MQTLVIQSFRTEDVPLWMSQCMETVKVWASFNEFDYRIIGDDLFDLVPDWVRDKTKNRKVVATDIARLIWTRNCLAEFDRVIWCDADFLIFVPDRFTLNHDQTCTFGREVWIEQDDKVRLRARKKIHNAFMVFGRGNSFLDFYIESALRMLARVDGDMVPQFIGPKFLTTLHYIIGFDELPAAAMFSPLVLRDILSGGGDALDLLRLSQGAAIYGANLSASYVDRDGELALSNEEMERVVETLRSSGDRLFAL